MQDKNLNGFAFVGVFEGEYMTSNILRLFQRDYGVGAAFPHEPRDLSGE